MRTIIAAITFLAFPSIQADLLCDAVCDFNAAFPDGGTIEANASLDFIFGEGGFVNDGAVTTGYADQQQLSYTAGSELVFAGGGEIALGTGGNIDADDFTITSSGVVSLATKDGNATLSLDHMMMTGGGSLTVEANEIVLAGTLSIGENTTVLLHAANSVSLEGSITGTDGSMLFLSTGNLDTGNTPVEGCAIDTSLAGTITTVQVILTTATSGDCSDLDQVLNLDPGTVTSGTLSISSSAVTLDLSDNTVVTTEIDPDTLEVNTEEASARNTGEGSLSLLFAWMPVLLFLFRGTRIHRCRPH